MTEGGNATLQRDVECMDDVEALVSGLESPDNFKHSILLCWQNSSVYEEMPRLCVACAPEFVSFAHASGGNHVLE